MVHKQEISSELDNKHKTLSFEVLSRYEELKKETDYRSQLNTEG